MTARRYRVNQTGDERKSSFGAARVGRCSWRNMRREKEAKRQCLESRIDLIERISPGILLQAFLSAAQDRRTYPDCGPSVTSRLRKYGTFNPRPLASIHPSRTWIRNRIRCRYREGYRAYTRYDSNRGKDTAIDLVFIRARYCYRKRRGLKEDTGR